MRKTIYFLIAALLLGSWAANAATVITVTSKSNSGNGSLRTIVGSAVDGDTIRFSSALQNETIALSSASAIVISKNLVIDGGENNITISGGGTRKIFQINLATATNVTLSNLTLSNALNSGIGAIGGAINTNGNAKTGAAYTFDNIKFENNVVNNAGTVAYGAAIGSSANTHFIIKNCTFIGNRVDGGNSVATTDIRGGAAIGLIGQVAQVDISNSLFENNSAPDGNGGAIIASNATITGSVFKNNTAKFSGGAIFSETFTYNDNIPSLKLLGNTFIGNSTEGATLEAVVRGGGVWGTINGNADGSTVFAGNIFQGNTSQSNAAYNDFQHTDAAHTVTSGGYSVFKGAVPPTAIDTWTSNTNDIASATDIVDATTYKLSDASAAYSIIETQEPLIAGVAWQATDIFGNAVTAPYNAGADQEKFAAVVLPDITASAPSVYQNGVEKSIGSTVVGGATLKFNNVVFFAPSGVTFTTDSYKLKNGTAFTLSGERIQEGPAGAGTVLLVTVNFNPTAAEEFEDTLTISADGANDFVLPLRGTGLAYGVSPVVLQNFGGIAVGNTSDAKTVTVTASAFSGNLSYSLKDGQNTVFTIDETEYSATEGGKLKIQFVPQTAGAVYTDTLIVSSSATELIYKVPLEGKGEPVAVSDANLYFHNVAINSTKSLPVTVTVAPENGVNITGTVVNDNVNFTVTPADGWSATTGGVLNVNFTPTAIDIYNATLTLSGEGFSPLVISLNGGGVAQPVVTSDSLLYRFGNVPVSQTVVGEIITVTLTNHLSQLNAEGVFSLAKAADYAVAQDSIFKVVSVHRDGLAPLEPNIVEVTLSFTPAAEREYADTLIVKADYATEYRIPLSGTGIIVTNLPAVDQKATTVLAQNGNIVVAQAPVGSIIRVYNIGGQLVKTQLATSDIETITTFSKGIYIVVIGNERWKIVL